MHRRGRDAGLADQGLGLEFRVRMSEGLGFGLRVEGFRCGGLSMV